MVKRTAYPSPSSPSPRRGARTLPINRQRLSNIGRVVRASGMAAGRAAISRAIPQVAAAQMAYAGAKYAYKRFTRKDVLKRSRKRGSAANAKYVGRFESGTKKTSLADEFINKGVVVKQEHGGVSSSTRQVVYVAHSTMPVIKVADAMIRATIKKLFAIAGHSIKNDTEIILSGAYYDGIIRLAHKEKDGEIEKFVDFAVTAASSTLGSLSTAVYTWMSGLSSSNNNFQLLTLRFYMQYGTLATAIDLRSEIDLAQTKVKLYSRSVLKIQNRTINSTGNDQADDVDNVPLEGRMFEFKTNGTIYRDYNQPSAPERSMVTTSTGTGCLQTPLPSETGTSFFQELPERTQFVGCYSTAKSVLNPGQMRDSKMVDQQTIGFQKLFHTIFAYSLSNIGGTNQYWIGRTRIFGFEKKLNAVAMTTENQFHVAFEHQIEIGADILINKSTQTAPVVLANTYQT